MASHYLKTFRHSPKEKTLDYKTQPTPKSSIHHHFATNYEQHQLPWAILYLWYSMLNPRCETHHLKEFLYISIYSLLEIIKISLIWSSALTQIMDSKSSAYHK